MVKLKPPMGNDLMITKSKSTSSSPYVFTKMLKIRIILWIKFKETVLLHDKTYLFYSFILGVSILFLIWGAYEKRNTTLTKTNYFWKERKHSSSNQTKSSMTWRECQGHTDTYHDLFIRKVLPMLWVTNCPKLKYPHKGSYNIKSSNDYTRTQPSS